MRLVSICDLLCPIYYMYFFLQEALLKSFDNNQWHYDNPARCGVCISLQPFTLEFTFMDEWVFKSPVHGFCKPLILSQVCWRVEVRFKPRISELGDRHASHLETTVHRLHLTSSSPKADNRHYSPIEPGVLANCQSKHSSMFYFLTPCKTKPRCEMCPKQRVLFQKVSMANLC